MLKGKDKKREEDVKEKPGDQFVVLYRRHNMVGNSTDFAKFFATEDAAIEYAKQRTTRQVYIYKLYAHVQNNPVITKVSQ